MEALSPREPVRRRLEALSRMSLFPYHARVREIMVSPVYACPADLSVREMAREMARRRVSSAVVLDAGGRVLGIVTERDLLTKVVSRETVDPDRTPVAAIMSAPAVTVAPEERVYRALSLIARYGIKHLPVVDPDGRPVGILTLRHLLRLAHQEPFLLIGRLEEARSPQDLAGVREELPGLAANRLSSGASAVDTMIMLSLVHRDLHRRAFELALESMGEEPPVPFCLFLTGSHGRGEALLAPDQDHGLILDDYPDERFERVDGYFRELAARFGRILEEAGYPRCPGYIMSENPLWRKRLGEWCHQFVLWLELASQHTVRYLTLVFDASPLLGETALFRRFREHAFRRIGEHHDVIRQMFEEEAGHRVPLGLFGRFIVERHGPHRGELHLKRSGLIFVVEAARVLCLKEGITEVSTLERIRALRQRRVVSAQDAEYAEHAFHLLVQYALQTQVKHWQRGEEVSYWLDPEELSAHDRDMLRYAFQAVKRLKELVEAAFGHAIL